MLSSKQLVEEYKARFQATDAQVADELRTSRTVITEARAGTQELALEDRLILADKVGYAWARDAILALMGSTGAWLKAKDNKRAAREAIKKASKPKKHGNPKS